MDHTKTPTIFKDYGEVYRWKQYPINLVTISGFRVGIPALGSAEKVAEHKVRIRAALITNKRLRLADESEIKAMKK